MPCVPGWLICLLLPKLTKSCSFAISLIHPCASTRCALPPTPAGRLESAALKEFTMSYLFEFSYSNPTQIVFGTHSFAKLGGLIPAEAKVLLLYGGGSIKRNGVYEQVMQALGGRQVVEFAGVEPNPTLETLEKAVARSE